MVKVRLLAASILLVMATTYCSSVEAGTVGLWLFDTMTDATYATAGTTDPIGGETLFDSSGNNFDFVSNLEFGSMLLDDDTPLVMGTNTYSLESINGGARFYSTPVDPIFDRNNTGELTVEFWFKYLRPSPTLGYIAAFDGGSTAENLGNWDLYGDSNGDIRFGTFSNNAGNPFVEVKTDFTSGYDAADGNWHHLAFSVDSVGTLTSYFDGDQVQQSAVGAAGAAVAPKADKVNLGFYRESGTFGDHDFLIDELRISDTALLPGSGSGIGELAWNTQLGTPPPVLPPRGADFAENWIRSREFTLSSWDSTNHYDLYTAAGFNAVMGGGPEAIDEGVEDHYLAAFSQLDNQARTNVQIGLNQGVSAFFLKDEIPPGDIPGIGDVAAYIRSVDDQTFLIAGLGSSNPSYIDDIVTTIQPEALLHAYYPFQGETSATDDWTEALSNTALVRERTLFHNVAYFSYLQTFEDLIAGNNTIDDNRRLPTESEFRAEAFAKLTAGVKGFVYFRFQDGMFEDIALVDPSGTTSDLYAPVAAANDEFLNLGQSLRHLTSTDWRFVSGGVSATPAEISDWDASAGNGLIDGITINGASLDLKDALVGYFSDDDDGEYFMLANMYHGDSLDAAAASVDFTITFDSSVNSLWRLNRLTGSVEELTLTGNVLNLTLPGGTGDLFKFGDGMFAGLAGPGGLTGDYNGNGIIDAADYTVWRDTMTAGGTVLANDPTPGVVDESDFQYWRAHFGETLGSGSGASLGDAFTAVPEPSTAFLLCLAICLLALKRRRVR